MNELKIEVLQKFFRGECNMLGLPNVKKIVNGPVELVRSNGGSNLDTSLIVAILINSATFIDAVINIYQFLKKEEKAPTYSNINTMIVNNTSITINVSSEKKEEIIQHIIERLNQFENKLQ